MKIIHLLVKAAFLNLHSHYYSIYFKVKLHIDNKDVLSSPRERTDHLRALSKAEMFYDFGLSDSLLSSPSRFSMFWDFSSNSSYRRLEMSCLISLSSPEQPENSLGRKVARAFI